MDGLLLFVSRLAGIVGVVVSVAAVIVRLGGAYTVPVLGIEARTMLLGGIAAIVIGCFSYLALLAEHRRGG
ncbi:MAG: hypothetical protein JSW68_05840 [Burkholderiales bacterium]|nr:MAG: hypothetical protein JSW68_05840 [Burkholderiales bacterium]